jgi:hypothetical protein
MKPLALRRMASILLLLAILAGSLPPRPAGARQPAGPPALPSESVAASMPRQPASAPVAARPAAPRDGCYATDIDCDHDVDEADVKLVAGGWNCATGDACYAAAYDLDANGLIDAFDLAWVSNDYDTTPPVVTITSPAEGETVGMSGVTVAGTIVDAHAVVSATVNGVAAVLSDHDFSASVPLGSGNQVLQVVAR